MTSKELFERYRDQGVVRNTALLFPQFVALQFLQDCQRSGVPVVSIEGFKVTGEWVQPLVEFKLDFSDAENSVLGADERYVKAQMMILSAGPDVHFEFVLNER